MDLRVLFSMAEVMELTPVSALRASTGAERAWVEMIRRHRFFAVSRALMLVLLIQGCQPLPA